METIESGWYPDPDRGPRLRWWDGEDWTDHFRSRTAELDDVFDAYVEPASAVGIRGEDVDRIVGAVQATARTEMSRAIDEIRSTATDQVDRVVDEVRTQASRVEPLISEAASAIGRWVRRAAVIAFMLLVLWFVVQWLAGLGTAELIRDVVDRITEFVDETDDSS